ncbi:MAG TPA: TolC family protein, partial [Xanthomonadaceae bacterium]|nr:TolC family protein [Xanthomonadaceae bacterium]
GCVTYSPQPLDTRVPAPTDAGTVAVDAAKMPLPELRTHVYDPSDGFDITEIAMLAVANNSDLRLARDDAHIARAQAFAAGLLPDPQIALNQANPTQHIPGSDVEALGYGVTYDVNTLLRHSADTASAHAAQTKAELDLLWKEWQTVAQARLLFVRNVFGERNLAILEQEQAMFVDRQKRLQRALDAGNMTADVIATSYTDVTSSQQKIDDAQRKLEQNWHDLNTLLGLAPSTRLKLVGDADVPDIDEAGVRALMADLPRRRPDLVELEAGYRSEEEKFRSAVIQQFPVLTVGFNRARDTSGIYSQGFALALSLPIFNGNRGNIAIEKATRKRLHDEYEGRLVATQSEVDAILDDRALAMHQLKQCKASEAELARLAEHSQAAYSAANIDVLNYTIQRDALISKRLERLGLEQALVEQQVGLQTLLGGELPTADVLEESSK